MTPTLQEYRCSCGKLLFKGLLPAGIVEIKCKRCNGIFLFGEANNNKIYPPFIIVVGKNGLITNYRGIESVLGYSRQEFVGRAIADFCPLLNDKAENKKLNASLKKGDPYEIKDNVYLLKDGGRLPLRSYLFGICQDGSSGGYCIFSGNNLS